MTASITATPGRLNLTIYRGRTDAVRITWPEGQLPPGDWTATVTAPGHDPFDLPAGVSEDTLTLDIPADTGHLLHLVASWLLDLDDRPVIAGTFRVTDQPGLSTIDTTVQLVEHVVQVTVVGGTGDAPVQSVNEQTGEVVLTAADVGADPAGAADTVAGALAGHEADESAHGDPLAVVASHESTRDSEGAHGRIVHDWRTDGWSPFDEVVVTQHGDQAFDRTVTAAGRGRITGPVAADSNHRVWFLHRDSLWRRSRVTALLWGPSTWTASPVNRPQLGVVTGAQQLAGGAWVGYVAWINIVGTDPTAASVLVRGWWSDGVTLTLGEAGTAGGMAQVDRRGRVVHARHEFFFVDFLHLTLAQPHAAMLNPSATVTVTGMADDAYDQSSRPIAGAQVAEQVLTLEASSAPTAPDPVAGGLATPTNPWRALPKWIAVDRQAGSHTLRVKEWAQGRPEPGWDDPRHVQSVAVAPGDMPAFVDPDAPGLSGILVGHAHSGSHAEVGSMILEGA